MLYDFDELIDRRGSGSYKWDEAESNDVLPLWVADMDFRVAPPITEALQRRVAPHNLEVLGSSPSWSTLKISNLRRFLGC
jgi:bifunctional pyridoxal-dependent enzyme with beta-cystathionase and maltose regulon repressor activities